MSKPTETAVDVCTTKFEEWLATNKDISNVLKSVTNPEANELVHNLMHVAFAIGFLEGGREMKRLTTNDLKRRLTELKGKEKGQRIER